MQKTISFVAFVAILIGTMGSANADTNDPAELSAPDVQGIQRKVAVNEVTLNGKTLFFVPNYAGTATVAQRTDAIRDRLEEIVAHYRFGAEAVTVTEKNADTYVLSISGETIVSVDSRLAQASGVGDAKTLAQSWANALQTNLPTSGRHGCPKKNH